jgi:hypothetical protein
MHRSGCARRAHIDFKLKAISTLCRQQRSPIGQQLLERTSNSRRSGLRPSVIAVMLAIAGFGHGLTSSSDAEVTVQARRRIVPSVMKMVPPSKPDGENE